MHLLGPGDRGSTAIDFAVGRIDRELPGRSSSRSIERIRSGTRRGSAVNDVRVCGDLSGFVGIDFVRVLGSATTVPKINDPPAQG